EPAGMTTIGLSYSLVKISTKCAPALPSRWPLPLLWQAGPFISGQKIGGICEEKMRLCEAKVKMVKIASSLHVCMKSNLQASLSPYLYSDGKSGNQYPDKAANRNKIPPHPL
ncbi:hypothetical protein, partial [Aeromonas caviae]|uniref:hypothetical protein n=1 Tax=Aeromonas caviae TaxID=648 RepID=UPI001FFD38B0